jgi:coenzyme F420-reducing hydrogenase delta subunit
VRVQTFVAARRPSAQDVVVIPCDRGAGGVAPGPSLHGAAVYPVSCAGSLHTSVIEYLLRAGVGGVLVVSCPPRDCWNREGAKWLEQRLYHDREAELRDRVDRRRVRLAYAAAGETARVLAELHGFRAALAALEAATREAEVDVSRECDTVPEEASR